MERRKETRKKSLRGARKTKTITGSEKCVYSSKANCSAPARNLPKSDLGGVIFGCKHHTMEECYSNRLFGLPKPHYLYVRNIKPGLPLFLFNYSDRMLHGLFEAASVGQLCINKCAWIEDSTDSTTPYPAQVKFCVQKLCQPLTEDQFRPIISDNYYEEKLFWFEMDHNQTKKLISLFLSFPITSTTSLPKHVQKLNSLLEGSCDHRTMQNTDCMGPPNRNQANFELACHWNVQDDAFKIQQKLEGRRGDDAGKNEQELAKVNPSLGNSYSSVLQNTGFPDVHQNQSVIRSISYTAHVHKELDAHGHQPDSEWECGEDCCVADVIWPQEANIIEDATDNHNHEALCHCPYIEKSNSSTVLVMSASVSPKPWVALFKDETASATQEESENLNMAAEENFSNWNELQQDWESAVYHDENCQNVEPPIYEKDSMKFQENLLPVNLGADSDNFNTSVEEEGCTSSCLDFESEPSEAPKNKDLPISCEDANECSREAVLPGLESINLYPIVTKLLLEVEDLKAYKLMQAQKINSLEQELVESRFEIQKLKNQWKMLECSSLPSSRQLKAEEYITRICESIFVAGGCDGSSLLSTLDSYSPSLDLRNSLSPMNTARSNYGAAKLHGELYIIGGLSGNMWYDTVESYNPVSNQWTCCPTLTKQKGSLASVSLNDKIFAIGGGDGIECFSEVEFFDPHCGRWTLATSMLYKRFVPAAVEINGVLYVVGGYDGKNYLKSFERYDPRECSWTELKSMKTKKGCHSLAVLNEKLYALGGYDGESMVSTVEVFDLRKGLWLRGESMNTRRGYFGNVVVGRSIYAIGGLKDSEVLDTVEIYREDRGWQMTDLKGIGKRCFFSAVVL